jgi:hypothetical protein
MEKLNMNKRMNWLMIGAGGIGGLFLDLTARALAFGGLASRVGGVSITVMDADIVELRNLPHQRFAMGDIGRPKVDAVIEPLVAAGVCEQGITFIPISENLTEETDLTGYDLVIVAVDRAEPRTWVHTGAKAWVDLRSSGDGFVLFSHETDSADIAFLPVQSGAAGCQLPGAIESGNIQFGFSEAASHGAQWAIQWLRSEKCEPTMLPRRRMMSIHMGELPFPQLEEMEAEE